MVSERFPHLSGDLSLEYYNTHSYEMTVFNPARRWSGSIHQEKSSQIAHSHSIPRRCSVQGDRSQYLPTPTGDMNAITSQSRFHCIQKPPLRNVLSAPQPVNMDPSRLLPRPPVVQCSDMMQSLSLESVDAATSAAETARYKTELCRPFEETGQCRYGGKCQFAHGMQELRSLNRHPKYKTELCRTFHTIGFCSYGQRCNFIHNDEERRGPAQSAQSTAPPPTPSRTKPAMSMVLPIKMPMSTTDSPVSSISSGSPSQSPSYLQEETFARLSPAPSFGSDGVSVASSYTPPGSPKHELITDYQLSSPLDMGFSIAQLIKMNQ